MIRRIFIGGLFGLVSLSSNLLVKAQAKQKDEYNKFLQRQFDSVLGKGNFIVLSKSNKKYRVFKGKSPVTGLDYIQISRIESDISEKPERISRSWVGQKTETWE